MGLLLSKIIPALLSPVSLACLSCLAAGILALRRKAAGAAGFAFAAAAMLYAAASPIVSRALIRGLERQYPEPASYPRAAAIVLLGGGVIPDVEPRRHPEVNREGNRLLQTARLWKAGLAPRVVTTGGAIPFMTNYPGGPSSSDAYLNARLLTELFGIPDSSILRLPESRNTHEDALYAARLFERLGMTKDILLVTTAMHLPRAVRLFRKQGFAVRAVPSDYRAGAKPLTRLFALFPSEWALAQTADALHEYAGLAAYSLMGRF